MDAITPSLLQLDEYDAYVRRMMNGWHAAHLPPASRTSTWTLLFSVKRFATTLPAVPPNDDLG